MALSKNYVIIVEIKTPDQNVQNLYPFSDQNGAKTLTDEAAHTYMADIGQSPRDFIIPFNNEMNLSTGKVKERKFARKWK